MYQIEKYTHNPIQHHYLGTFKYYQQPSNKKVIRKQIIINHAPKIEYNLHSEQDTSSSSSSSSNNDEVVAAKQQQQPQQQQQQPHVDNKSNLLNKKSFMKFVNKRYKNNCEVLYYLNAGDVIEFSKYDEIWNESDRSWGIYAGNGLVIRFDGHTCQIVCEPYWNLANHFYMSHNIDLDRTYYCLPAQAVLNRAYYALQNNHFMKNNFSSDKNFAMWCRFDINKSDIEFSTNLNQCPQEASKYIMVTRFLESIDKYKSEIKNDGLENENNEK